MCRGWGVKVPGHRFKSLGDTTPPTHPLPMARASHSEKAACPSRAPSVRISVPQEPRLPLKDLCHLVLVEDEAGVVVPQDGHDAQAQAGRVAAHQVRGLEQQLGLHYAQFVQKLAE